MASRNFFVRVIFSIFIFAADELEQGKIKQTIEKIRAKSSQRAIIADFSATPFTTQRYEKFLQNKARELYFKDSQNQASQVKLAQKNAADLVAEWIRQLTVSSVRVLTSAKDSVSISGEGNFHKYLRELNGKFFCGGIEEISLNEKIFSTTGLTENVAKAALGDDRIRGNISWLNFLSEPFRQLVKSAGEIWDELRKPPFGLMKCPGSIFLLALMLKDYADNNFYLRDYNSNTSSLTGERLCSLIVAVVKDLPQACECSSSTAYLLNLEEIDRRIENLFAELQLVEAVNLILDSPQKNLADVRFALKEKLNQIKIPRVVTEEFFPAFKDLFQVFNSLIFHTATDFTFTAEIVKRNAHPFKKFFDNQFDTFAKAVTSFVDGVPDSQILEYVFKDMPAGIFFMTRDDFSSQLKTLLKKINRIKKTNLLFSIWCDITGTPSPAEWSKLNEIPILCVFQKNLDVAQNCFAALNSQTTLANDSDLNAALKFIQSDEITALAKKDKCSEDFRSYFCGELRLIVDDDNLRAILRKHAGDDVYSWFTKKKICEGHIRAFAKKNYAKKFLPTVRKIIRDMNAQEAKKYLDDLTHDMLFGVRILENSGGGGHDGL